MKPAQFLTNFAKLKLSSPLKTGNLAEEPSHLTEAIAAQIACLLNTHNKLTTRYYAERIAESRTKYYPEHYQGLVFGSIGVLRVNFVLSEIKHLVVHPAFRKMGMGARLLKTALRAADTPLLFATIREGNKASLSLFTKAGFSVCHSPAVKGRKINFLLKHNDLYQTTAPDSTEFKDRRNAIRLDLLGSR